MLAFKLLSTALVQKKPLLMLAHFLSQLKKLSSSSTDHHYYTVTRISILSMQKINWNEHKQLWEWKEYK